MTSIKSPKHLYELPTEILHKIVLEVARDDKHSFASGFDRTSRQSLSIVINAAASVVQADAVFKIAQGMRFICDPQRSNKLPPYNEQLTRSAHMLLAGIANVRPESDPKFAELYAKSIWIYNGRDEHPPVVRNREDVVNAVARYFENTLDNAEQTVQMAEGTWGR